MTVSRALHSADIKRLAIEAGFHQVGITQFSKLKESEPALQAWIQEGRHGTMRYLENFKKRHERFQKEFPDARGVIVLGVNYLTPDEDDRDELQAKTLRGLVARYARGRDYHHVIHQRHEELITRLKNIRGEDFKAVSCVDSWPIPERFAGGRSGIGFVGKHTGLLSRDFGPWFFLSEIVTDLDLEEDHPAEGDCGPCARCQEVCPTGALDRDYRIDARLCISYLTIEHKDDIPRELRSKIGQRVFGCDECLNVCPLTSKQKETSWKELHPASGVGKWLGLEELFSISSNRDYEKKYQGTALLRVGRKQMLRNACIVLGNSGSEEAIPYLEKALRDSSPLLRSHAAWALGQLPYEEAHAILRERLDEEKDLNVKEEIQLALK